MKVNWAEWEIGGKVIFIAFCIGVFSMFLNWVDIGIASQNGLSQGTFLLLLLWAYPVMMLLKDQEMKKIIAYACVAMCIIANIIYMSSNSIEMFGKVVNATGMGAIVFLFASVALAFGIFKYNTIQSAKEEAIES